MLVVNEYYIGATIRLTGTFSDLTSAPADPTSVTLKIKAPDGTVTIMTDSGFVRDDVGLYHYDYLAVACGAYCYRWEGVGAVTAVMERTFSVLPGCFES